MSFPLLDRRGVPSNLSSRECECELRILVRKGHNQRQACVEFADAGSDRVSVRGGSAAFTACSGGRSFAMCTAR